MMKAICTACLALFALAVNAQDLKGTWRLERVQVVKSGDAKLTIGAEITPAAAFTGKDKLPEQLIFSEQSVSYLNDGSVASSGRYATEGNKLWVDLSVAVESYTWEVGNDRLVLTATFERADGELSVSVYELSGYYKQVNE